MKITKITGNPTEEKPQADYFGVRILDEETNTAVELRISHLAIVVLTNNGKDEEGILESLKENALLLLKVIEKHKQTTILLKNSDFVEFNYLENHGLLNQWQDKVVEVVPLTND